MQALQLGLLSQQDDDDKLDSQAQEAFNSMGKDEREELAYTFKVILGLMPGLKDQLVYMGDNINAIDVLGSYLNHYATDARGDHLGSLHERIVNYLPDFSDSYPVLKPQDSKWKRGFQNITTGWLLCLQSMLTEFLNDLDGFCRQVRDGEIDIPSDEFPSFLYDEALYNPDELDAGLLRHPLLLKCVSDHGNCESRPGRPPLTKKYDMTQVTPRNIAYLAVLHSWSNVDMTFDLEKFFFEILKFFQDEEWGKATLEWWNKAVFGTTAKGQGGMKKQTRPQSASAKLKVQRTARAAVQSGTV
ncbi:hypothetical protein BKA93DRAFT_823271 [Sparassis latifolia]